MRLRKAHLEEAIAGIDKRFQRKRCSQREPPKGRSQAFYPKVFLSVDLICQQSYTKRLSLFSEDILR